jgi:hypothetical protein
VKIYLNASSRSNRPGPSPFSSKNTSSPRKQHFCRSQTTNDLSLPVIPVNRLLFRNCISSDVFIRAISVHNPPVPLQIYLLVSQKRSRSTCYETYLLVHFIQTMHYRQNGIDYKRQFGVFVVRCSNEAFMFWSTLTNIFLSLVSVIIIEQETVEFLLPIFTKPDIAGVVVDVEATKILFKSRNT